MRELSWVMKMVRIHRRNLKQMREILEALVLQRKRGGGRVELGGEVMWAE